MKIVFLGGNEPYLIDYYIHQVKESMILPELNFAERDVLDEESYSFLVAAPVMAPMRVLLVQTDSIEAVSGAWFERLEALTNVDAFLLVRFRKHDARTSFFKKLKSKNYIKLYEKSEQAAKLNHFIKNYVKSQNGTISDEAIQEFLCRENYLVSDSVTLYTIRNDLLSVLALSKEITEETIKSIVASHDVDNAFLLAKLLVSKDINGLLSQAELLRGQEIPALSALLREYRISYKAKSSPLKDIGVYKQLFSELSAEELSDKITFLTEEIAAVKTGKRSMSVVLKNALLHLI